MLRHDECGVAGGGVGTQGDRGRAHHFAHRARERAPRKDDAADDILSREDAQRPPGGVDDRHRADARRLHRRQRIAERRIGTADDGRPVEQHRQRRRQVAALRRGGCVLRLQSLPREVEQVREAPRAEILEDRRCREHRVEDGGREAEAERVARCAVDARHAASRDQGAERKHFAGGELPERGRVAMRVRPLAAHRALPDHVAMPGTVGPGPENDFSGCEIPERRRAHDPVEVFAAHRRERRVRRQRLPHSGENGGRGNGRIRHDRRVL